MVLALTFAGCASDSSSGGGNGETVKFDYTLFSTDGNMPVGRGVIYLYGDWSGSTDEFDAPVGDPRISSYTHEFEGVVEVAGEISVDFNHSRTDPYWASVYLDVDNSLTLSPGDLVWIDTDDVACGGVNEGLSGSGTQSADVIWEDGAEDVCFDYGEYTESERSY